MATNPKKQSVSIATMTSAIEEQIYVIRGVRVMMDADLASLYGVPTKRLNEQVKRNKERFPADFMFRLTPEEAQQLSLSRSQSATLNRGKNIKYAPYAFTEHGAIMLASVLNSAVAIDASIRVVRAFVRLRAILALDKALANKLEALEKKYDKHDEHFKTVFAALRQLLEHKPGSQQQIGFRTSAKKR